MLFISTVKLIVIFMFFSLFSDSNIYGQRAKIGKNGKKNSQVKSIDPSNATIVKIGDQKWMSKNLNVSTFRNGDQILEAKSDSEWKIAGEKKIPSFCYLDFNEANGEKYGKLYNWYAVNDSRGLAPSGFHIPTVDEWIELGEKLDGLDRAGKKLKSISGWKTRKKNSTATCPDCAKWNESYRKKVPCHTCKDTRYVTISEVKETDESSKIGFLALPGGFCKYNGIFFFNQERSIWWTQKEESQEEALSIYLEFSNDELQKNTYYKESGCSVRCIKD